MLRFAITISFAILSSFSFADNLYTDTFLQPAILHNPGITQSLALRVGVDEGSSEMQAEGLRVDAPRYTIIYNANNQLSFKASIAYTYADNTLHKTYTLSDPSFFTTIQLPHSNTITIGVTEPAANRPLEPDVVRFHAFYTQSWQHNNLSLIHI